MALTTAYVQSWLYQVKRPWHWLTHGQNAAALQGICAFLAFFLLWRYTVYTRRMMELGEITRRAMITPVFTAKNIAPHYLHESSDAVCGLSVTIRNIGQGPAAIFWAWHQPVSENFSPSKSEILIQSALTQLGNVPESDLMSGDSMEIHFNAYDIDNPSPSANQAGLMHSFPSRKRWLFVVDAIDQAGGRHQLQMLKNAGDDAPIDVKMVHALGETFGERFMKKVRRTVEILQAAKAEVLNLFR